MTSRLERLVSIEDQVRKERYPTVDSLCRMFEVQPRTIYDDIRVLREDLGLAIEYDRFRNGYINRDPKRKLPPFDLTDGEIFALTLGKEILSQYTGTAFEPILKSAIEKISQRLPDRVKVEMEDIRCMVKFDPGAVIPISRKMFLDLNSACERTMPVNITYYAASTGETTARKIDPYRLIEHSATWYVLAYCHLRKQLRLFALHRIHDYTLIDDQRFRVQPDLDIDKWLDAAFQLEHKDEEHKVKVHFQANAARYIRERRWHHTQELTEHDDGSCTLEFSTLSLDEAKRWILIYGSEAEVIEPQQLRTTIAAELQKAAAQYLQSAPSS